MPSVIELDDIQAWVEPTKLGPLLTELDTKLAEQISVDTFSRLQSSYDTSAWVGPSTTPNIVKRLVAMQYVGWTYQKVYSENEDLSPYGTLLLANADKLLMGIIDGSVTVTDLPEGAGKSSHGSPAFFPTDASSAQEPTFEDPSLGGPVFSMGRQW